MDEVLKIALERDLEPLPMPAPITGESVSKSAEEKITH